MTSSPARTVLITGASGFLGRHCLPALCAAFDEVHAISTMPRTPALPRLKWHTVDLLHTSSVVNLVAAVRPTHLLHLAWMAEHGQFWNSPLNTRWLEASVVLLQAFAACGGQRVVTAGTCAEYNWQTPGPYCEEDRCAPHTLYGTCKHALRLAAETLNCSTAHTRIFHLFGPGEDRRRLTPSVLMALLAGERAQCTRGKQIADFMHVEDAAAAHVQLLTGNVQGPVNVASGSATSVRNFVQTMGNLLGRPGHIDFGALPSREDEPANLSADIARLRGEVGFTPPHSTEDRLRDYIRVFQPAAAGRNTMPGPLSIRPAMARQPRCPACDAPRTQQFLRRNGVPVHQNLVLRDAGAARHCGRGTLDMHICGACGFVFNAAFDPSKLAYGREYDNTQTCSPAFKSYVNGLVRHLIDQRGVRGKQIVEVGCGKGDFLRRLLADATLGNTGWGFDPAYVGPETDLGGRLRFERSYYDARCARLPAEVIICRHVIEHIARPGNLLHSMRSAIEAGRVPDARIFLETPCVSWILRHEVVWDLFYEHCSLFTATSLQSLCERAGFRVSEVRPVFGQQYLWLEGELERSSARRVRLAEAEQAELSQAGLQARVDRLVELALNYGKAEARRLAQWREIVDERSRHGGVCVWGAGAKGVTFANLADPDGTQIDCIIDLNPAKQGGFIPGTAQPILAPEALASRNVRTALVLNPNYLPEITQMLRRVAPHVEPVDPMPLANRNPRAA